MMYVECTMSRYVRFIMQTISEAKIANDWRISYVPLSQRERAEQHPLPL
jgi:hypothetical protein